MKAEANDWRRRAEPVWDALDGRDRDRLAFEASLAHLEQQRLCFTVMGEFNSGKSTLLNALIGEPLLAMDQLECTAVPTWIRWADDEDFDESRQGAVFFVNGESDAMALSEISAHTTLDQDAWKKIERVEITLPQPADEQPRPTGLVLVDTPGLNGDSELESRSIHQLGMSHVTIVVVPADGIGRKTAVELIHKALSIADRVMVVINRCDQQYSGDGFERFKDELHRRVPRLCSDRIYTLSAKRQFDGAAYRAGEDELCNDFQRFADDLASSVLRDPDSALRGRPRALLRAICNAEIVAIDNDDAKRDTDAVREVAAAQMRLEETTSNLERSREAVIRLARSTMMGEVSILQEFLQAHESEVERAMTTFVDGFDDATLLNQNDLDAVRDRVSAWLRDKMRPVFDRASRLLRASARRLIFDLEDRVRDVDTLNLPQIAVLQLNAAAWEREAGQASEALRRRSSEVDAGRHDVAQYEQVLARLQGEVRDLGVHHNRLLELAAQRKAAVAKRMQLGPKPEPKVQHDAGYETREVPRGGLFGWLVNLLNGPKKERVPVTRQRKDYSRVREWEENFKRLDRDVSCIDERMKPLAGASRNLAAKQDQLVKRRRQAEGTRARLRRAEARLADERETYRNASLATRRAHLKHRTGEELKEVFDLLPGAVEREAEEMLTTISERFVDRFQEAAARQQALLAADMERRQELARAQDARRARRSASRTTLQALVQALEADGSRQK